MVGSGTKKGWKSLIYKVHHENAFDFINTRAWTVKYSSQVENPALRYGNSRYWCTGIYYGWACREYQKSKNEHVRERHSKL